MQEEHYQQQPTKFMGALKYLRREAGGSYLNLQQTINSLEYFRPTQIEVEQLADSAEYHYQAANTFLFHFNQKSDYLFILLEGEVHRIDRTTANVLATQSAGLNNSLDSSLDCESGGLSEKSLTKLVKAFCGQSFKYLYFSQSDDNVRLFEGGKVYEPGTLIGEVSCADQFEKARRPYSAFVTEQSRFAAIKLSTVQEIFAEKFQRRRFVLNYFREHDVDLKSIVDTSQFEQQFAFCQYPNHTAIFRAEELNDQAMYLIYSGSVEFESIVKKSSNINDHNNSSSSSSNCNNRSISVDLMLNQLDHLDEDLTQLIKFRKNILKDFTTTPNQTQNATANKKILTIVKGDLFGNEVQDVNGIFKKSRHAFTAVSASSDCEIFKIDTMSVLGSEPEVLSKLLQRASDRFCRLASLAKNLSSPVLNPSMLSSRLTATNDLTVLSAIKKNLKYHGLGAALDQIQTAASLASIIDHQKQPPSSVKLERSPMPRQIKPITAIHDSPVISFSKPSSLNSMSYIPQPSSRKHKDAVQHVVNTLRSLEQIPNLYDNKQPSVGSFPHLNLSSPTRASIKTRLLKSQSPALELTQKVNRQRNSEILVSTPPYLSIRESQLNIFTYLKTEKNSGAIWRISKSHGRVMPKEEKPSRKVSDCLE